MTTFPGSLRAAVSRRLACAADDAFYGLHGIARFPIPVKAEDITIIGINEVFER